MKTINRAAAIIKPKQPYVDWANSFDDGGPTLDLEEARQSPNAYLREEQDMPEQLLKFVERHYRRIFEEKLDGWITDPDVWPKKRTLKVFKEWFDVEICEMVYDLGKKHLAVDDY